MSIPPAASSVRRTHKKEFIGLWNRATAHGVLLSGKKSIPAHRLIAADRSKATINK